MPKIKVIDTFAIPIVAYDVLNQLGTVSLFTDVCPDQDIILKRAGDGDVVVVNKTPLTADIINQFQKVQLIAETATIYDNIDIKAAEARGITVCNVPRYSTDSVAEHVFALILTAWRRLPECIDQVKKGGWVDEPLLGTELKGKTLGIVGFGKIG